MRPLSAVPSLKPQPSIPEADEEREHLSISPTPGSLGAWKAGRFEFSSPLAEAQWEREAYRQAVNSETWPKGRVVDPDTKALIDSDVAGPSHAIYRGPDGEHRFFDPHVAETPAIRAIRLRNFTGKTWAELNASKMPGEDEAAAHHAAKRAENAARGAKGSAPTPSESAFHSKPHTPIAKLMADPSDSAAAEGPRSDEFFADRKPAGMTATPGPVLVADLSGVPNAPGVGPIPGFALRPAAVMPEAVPVPSRVNALGQAVKQGVGLVEQLEFQTQKPSIEPVTRPVEAAADAVVDTAFQRATLDLVNDPDYADPTALARKLGEVVEWNQRFVIESYRNQPGVEAYHSPTAVELDLIKRSLRDRVLEILPEERRREVEQIWSEQPLIIKNGPTGISDVVETLTQASQIKVYIGGELAISTEDAAEMRGSPEIQLLNKITKEETEAFLKACAGISAIRHTGGTENDDGEKLTESWIQDVVNGRSTKGSRYMDITFEVEVDGQKCAFHINTADVTKSGLFTKDEWRALHDAATTMRRNGENWRDVENMWERRVTDGLIGKLNAFLAVAKPAKDHRTEEEMRKAVQDFLKLLDCADIEAACKDGAVINPSRDSRSLH